MDRDWIDWLVALVTLIGVGIAIWQSIRSGRISSEARRAIARTERHLTGNQVIGRVTQLQGLEQDLLKAVESGDDDLTIQLLLRLRDDASELVGMLEGFVSSDDDLVHALTAVGSLVTSIVSGHGDGRRSLRTQTKDLRQQVSIAMSLLARTAGSLMTSAQSVRDSDGGEE